MPQTTPILELQRQRMLLEIEYFTEKEAYRKLTESRGLARSVKRGDTWFPLRVGKSYYNSLNQLCIEVFRTTDQDIEHNFEFGRPVQFFKQPTPQIPTPSYYNFSATVSYVDGDRMVVAVPDTAPIIELQNTDQQLGVQLSFDETSYRTMFDALDRVMRAKNNRLAELRDLFYKPTPCPSQREGSLITPTIGNTNQVPLPSGGVRGGYISFPWLNPTQENAVNMVLRAKDVAIVHGPPGTGKTTTLVEAIFETLHREPQVLVWNGQDGAARGQIEMNADEVEFLSSAGSGQREPTDADAPPAPVRDEQTGMEQVEPEELPF